MASEVCADLNIINDEDVLRRMWQQTDDFGRKKEIRQRMYKLREQRLRDFYTGDNSDMMSRKHTSNTYTDSIADQGFMSLKSKEIRDSESPTRDIHRHEGDNSYWNTVQQSSYSDDGGVKSYERSSTGTGESADGASKLKVDSDERGFAISNVTESENGKTSLNRQQHDAQISAASHTKTDSGEVRTYSTTQEHQESTSSVTESKDSSSAYKSSKWENSSVSSSSSRKVISSSNYGKITSDMDFKALTSGDDVDFSNSLNQDKTLNTSSIQRMKSSSITQDNKKYQTCEESNVENMSESKSFIDSETRNNLRNNLQDINVNIIEDHFADRDSRRDSTSTYASEITSNIDDYSSQKDMSSTVHVRGERADIEKINNAVDQNIMTEINKLDSFLSTQNTGTNTPVSPRSVMGEVNWTIVSNNDGEFIYKDDKDTGSPGSRATPMKQPDNLDLPKECTEGQYMTTYNEHYSTKRISVDVSPTHDKFARSLRQTPPGTPRSLSRQSLDRSSPERKNKSSPRSSPDKERRTSTGSYTIERPGSARRKSSEVTRQTATSRDSTLKTKRKFSTTQNKATSKVRTSTPGTSPSTSPSRKNRERSDSASSASDSDASQVMHEKKSSTNIHKRADIVRRNLMDDFDKESTSVKTETSEIISNASQQPTTPERSPKQVSKSSETKTVGILRKESFTNSKTNVRNATEQKVASSIAPHVRETSPEYSSEGSVGKEIKNSQRNNSPDSSPERTAFTPIKQFRTSPEVSSDTIQVTASELDQKRDHDVKGFIMQEQINIQIQDEPQKMESPTSIDNNATPTSNDKSGRKIYSPKKQSTSQKENPSSPVEETDAARKSSSTRNNSTLRENSPKKEEKPRAPSPTKSLTSRKQSSPQRSPSPKKEQPRSASPSKDVDGRKISAVAKSPESKSRSPSPMKNDLTTITTRKSSVKRESSFKDTLTSSKLNRQNTPSPDKHEHISSSPTRKRESPVRKSPNSFKEATKARSPSPNKSTYKRDSSSSPAKSKSPSPQRSSKKRSHHLVSSPSVSPCSSPERSSERKQDKPKVFSKSYSKKSPDRDNIRTSRRSSIPRSEQSTVTRKTVETKIEIKSKPVTKMPSYVNKPKSSTPLKAVRTDSCNSIDRSVSSKICSTTIKKTVEKPTDITKKSTPSTKKIVTTTAVFSLQKPTVTSHERHNMTNTVSRTSTFKRTSSKEISSKKTEPSTNKKPIVTTTTKRIASRTNTPKTNTVNNRDEEVKTPVLTNPNSSTDKVTSDSFVEQLKKDENRVHGYKDETINLEISDLEHETRPELYPETEEDEENFENLNNKEDGIHKTEKTIQVDSKRKSASQFMVTIKKPTATTQSKPSIRPVTTRSSSGPIKSSPQSPAKSTSTKDTVTKRHVTNAVQKSDSLNMIRTKSDKNISKNTAPQKRQMSKPEISTGKSIQPGGKAGPTKQITETGIASRNVTTAKSATIKRVTPTKKRPIDTQSSSSSEDEGQNIPFVVTPNRQEQQFIEELEEMRRNEELEYATKLTATTNQENQLLSVIVQHPKSSRESSPDMSNKPQPFCTVSDDGGANPRYADVISEPEDVEVFNPKESPMHESYIKRQPRFEQVTDLDEESEAEEIKLNVSVADRVSHFIETSKNHVATPIREDFEPETYNDGAKNVLKAAAMFETIARNQTAPPAPGNKAPDIISRPSVFEARKGQIAPKTTLSGIIPNDESPNETQKPGLIKINSIQEDAVLIFENNQFEQTHADTNKEISTLTETKSVVKQSQNPIKDKKDISNIGKTLSAQKDLATKEQPEKTPKTDPTSRTSKTYSTPSSDKNKPQSHSKARPFEKTISASAEISSKRAFFERKAQTDTSSKQTRSPTIKERKPLTESVQNKENIRGSSPPRKFSQETSSFIESERKSFKTSSDRKTSRISPERNVSETSPERKISRASPDRKVSRTSPERRSSTSAPAKERKHSIKSESPERKMSFTKSVKERRSSFTKDETTTSQTTAVFRKDTKIKVESERKTSPTRESPEKRAPITLRNFPDHVSKSFTGKDTPEQKSQSSPVKERTNSFTRESPERSPVRKSSRTSPEKLTKSPDRSSPSQKPESETAELNKAGKFGVTLRRTSSTTSATPRRSSVPGETQEIEDVTDLSLLEIMMEKAVGYEQRRRIRAQIRIVKKNQDDRTISTKVSARQKSPVRSPTRQPTQDTLESKKPERRPLSPVKSHQERVTTEQRTVRRTSKPSEPQPKTPQPITNGYIRQSSPDRVSPTRRETTAEAQVQTVRKNSKTDVEVSSSMRSQKRVETLVESGVDCITSSYGVGPTDENGRPLFGLRALRRTNTNKQLTDDVDNTATRTVEVRQEVRTERTEEVVRDTNGRPLFGGLRALRARDTRETDSDTDLSDMPEQTSSAQLRELVQRHEKVVRETNGPQDQPRQKPRAKLRDSFISTEDEGKDQQTEGHLSEINNLNRGLSLRSIIQKHENIASTAGVVRSEVESSHTVVSSQTTVASDGTVSHSRNIVQGELSAKNGEEPVGKVTRSQFTYKSPRGDDEGVNKLTTTTTTLGGRRTSGPRITEVEDDGKTTKRSSVSEETSGTKVRKSSLKKVQGEDGRSERKFSSQEEEGLTKTTLSKTPSSQKFATDESKSTFSSTTRSTDSRTKTSSPTLRRQTSSEEETVEEKKKTITRGDSVRALQHKFQQATVSSTLKQSTPLSAERKSGRQSPEKRRESPTSDGPTVRRESVSKSSETTSTRKESLSKSSADERRESLTTTRVSGTSSFLDNTTKVTGVQDILTRMRNADLVSESGDTDADREARALLNKFLGASVILQGLEQGARNANMSDATPGSAALVSSVEKQRVATTRQKEEDIENIWDEQVLNTLLEQCTDYDGRRKLRARLRTVMAEHKACADLVALTGDSVANSGECRSPIDDSGTESGEDFRLLSPEILAEVQSALTRLEAALPGLDPVRREALIRLVNRLQSCLKLQPASQTSTPLNPPPPQPPPPQPPVRRYANRRQRHQRHTVGVSKEELADARRWLQESRQHSVASTENPSEVPSVESHSSTNLNELQDDDLKPVNQGFRPVKFNPNQSKVNNLLETVSQTQTFERSDSQEDPSSANATSTYSFPQDVSKADSGSSLLEYDPSLTLFTPAQSVQIAVHKAAINKQISEEESKRENSKREESYDSEDGDVSSVEEDHSIAMVQDGLEDAISSAQRLLQIATDNKNTSSHGRFQERSSKKQKMKRANTIDIPKPPNVYDESSPDEFNMTGAHMNENERKRNESEQKIPPPFKPKTESDLKFLAFLQKANSSNNDGKGGIYNPSARGGQPWTNRFVNIKTAFEKSTPQNKEITQIKSDPPPITQNWLNNSSKPLDPGVVRQGVNRTPQPLQAKLPWSTREEENGVVVGSLTLKPSPLTQTQKPLGPVNKFYHAPKSAFKPIEKKPLTQVKIFEPAKKPVVQNSGKPLNASYQNPQKNKQSEIKKSPHQTNKMTSSASGSVKQLATQKFSGENIPSKPIIKQYPVIQDKQFNAANSVKQHPFVEHISKPTDKISSVAPLPPPQFSSSIALTQKQLFDQSTCDKKVVKIPENKTLKEFKDGTKFSPPKQYINSPPPLNKQHSDPFHYPSEGKNTNILSVTSDIQDKSDSLPELRPIPYYSQEPAFVQHTSYIQPYDDLQEIYHPSKYNFSSDSFNQYQTPTQPIQEYPATYNQQYRNNNQTEHDHYTCDVNGKVTNEMVQPLLDYDRSEQSSLPYVPSFKEEPVHHRFSEESLVPNPLVLSDVLVRSPVQFSQYDLAPTQPLQPVKQTIPQITNTQIENNSSHSSLTSSKLSDSSSSIKQYLNVPYEYGLGKSPVVNNNSKSPYFDESSNNSPIRSPHLNLEEDEEKEISLSEGTEIQTAVAKVMGHAQCQKAVTVPSRKQHRFDDDKMESESLLRTLLKSPHSPTNISRKQSLEKPSFSTETSEPLKSMENKSVQSRTKPDEEIYSYPSVERNPSSKVISPLTPTEKFVQNKQYQDTYFPQNVTKIPVISEPVQHPKASENHTQSRDYRDIYSYPTVAKSPVVESAQNDFMQNIQNKPISSAASAFRPLVNNFAQPQESFSDRLPPVPSSLQNYGRKMDGDSSRLANIPSRVYSQNLPYSSQYYESDISPKPPPSISPSKSPTLRSSTSPSFPSVLQKSESWHQLVKEQKAQGRHPPPKSPRLTKTKSSHSLAFPKQFEAHLTPDTVAVKQSTVDQYLKPQVRQSVKTVKQKKTVSIVKLDENLENVDEAFESLFQQVAKQK